MSCDAVITINLSALRHNFSRVQACAGQQKILSMVKGDAYGHGMVRVAKVLSDSDGFAVATLAEAIALREAGIAQRILVLSRFQLAADLELFLHYDLEVCLYSIDQVSILEKATLSKPLSVWLKVDTGMHRLGVLAEEFRDCYERLKACPGIRQPIQVMTHLADADNRDSCFTDEQLVLFKDLTKSIEAPLSIANSAGILCHPRALGDWVRPGIMLYGASPFKGRRAKEEGLKPVMTLTAQVVSIKSLNRGDHVGYGATWTAPEPMLIATVAMGYADGYPRHVPSGTPTLLQGQVCPIVGRVSMDLLAIDCRKVPGVKSGDTVTLWGEGLPIEQIAEAADTIPYELMCHVSSRVRVIEKN